jgi:riboflavin kinase/FMN adenylyltransferase
MQVFSDYHDLPALARGASIALGNFDGVHRGHAHVLRHAHAGRPEAPLAVVSFEPHPREMFRPEDPPFRLTLTAERQTALAALGVRLLFQIPFDTAFAAMSAEAFIVEVLHKALGARHLACGSDFAFGHRRGGDTALLAAQAEILGIGLTVVPPLLENGNPVSSTSIRRLLQDGYPERAAVLLGRSWTVRGTVIEGDRRGRMLGFPTANLPLGRHLEPARGVYAITVRLPDETECPGVANIGIRPTVNGRASRVEAHLFDWAGSLYGQDIAVSLHHYLRPERRFDGLDALRDQIVADVKAARSIMQA